MATKSLAGVNYSLDGNAIAFFGAKGTKLSPTSWAVNAFTSNIDTEVDPGSIMPRVRGCIQGDIDAGNSEQIAQLQLGPRQAVVFFLEGGMTRDQLAEAAEGPGFVDIPGVPIDGRTLTVRVLEEPQYEVATADSDGHVLP